MTLSKKSKTWLVNLGILAFIALILYLIYSLWDIILPFFVAILLSYLFIPLVKVLNKRKIPLIISVILIYLVMIALIFLLFYLAVPELLKDSSQLLDSLPKLIDKINQWWVSVTASMQRINIPQSIIESISSSFDQGEEYLAKMAQNMVFSLVSFLKVALSLLLTPILSYYMIRDSESIKKKIIAWLPPKHRPEILRISNDINRIIREFIFGYLLVSVIVGFMTFIALKIIGVRYALLLGVIMGVADLIPYFGPFLGAVPALILAYVDSFKLAVIAAILLIVIQQLESAVITPKIIGDRIGLHPLTIILVVLIGGYWFGIVGMILCVPVAAALKLICAFMYSCVVSWKES